ncbi:MAG TPA: amidohydrolase family protein [Candidatus Limnocylindrales bacterium]|nr:amidohydrolase family protein [Candidatus Limnocylindrales bacterium]
MQKIDVHTHIITSAYFEALAHNRHGPRLEKTADGYVLWYGNGLKYAVDDRMLSIDRKLKDFGEAKIETQVVAIAMPGMDSFKDQTLAMKVNDEIAEIVEDYPGKFLGAAAVSLRDVPGAVDELDRAVKGLGFRSVEVFTNVGGKQLDDEEFYPFYEKAVALDVPILMHPTEPLMTSVMGDYGLIGMVGYIFETTLATLRLILGGVFDRYPKLKVVVPHMASTLPYLISRIDNQFRINPESRAKISKPPSEYFKLIYVDTAQSYYKPAIECALSLLAKDKILFGTDYPFANVEYSVESLSKALPESYSAAVFQDNAKTLFKI